MLKTGGNICKIRRDQAAEKPGAPRSMRCEAVCILNKDSLAFANRFVYVYNYFFFVRSSK